MTNKQLGNPRYEELEGLRGLAMKLIYLALRQIEAKWKRPPREWHAAKSQLAIQFGERFTLED